MIMNMKKVCEKKGIHEFSRTRGGWMKLVEGIDKTKNGGYSFIGDMFFKVGNFDTNLPTGLYLDQSTSVVDGEKVITMNLFKIHKGDVTLLKSTSKERGWATALWKYVDEYYKTDNVSAKDIVDTVYEMTRDAKIVDEVIEKLSYKQMEEDRMYEFRNWYEVLSHLLDAEVGYTHYKMLDEIPEGHELYTSECIREDHLAHNIRKYITKQLHFVAMDVDDYILDENTPVDFKNINPRVITSEQFKRMLRFYGNVHFLVDTLPNNTGYHNRVRVILYWYDDGQVFIRTFDYFVNTNKQAQIPYDIMGREC